MSETPSFPGAAVMAPHPAASAAARDVLIEGGNAIEAAVAALAVVSAVLPQAGGAGGDGLWLIREPGTRGRTRVLDARGRVGDAVTLRHFRERGHDAVPTIGPGSILTVPCVVAGWRAALDLAQALGGSMPVRRLLEPAITAAREGFATPDPGLRPMPSSLAAVPELAAPFLIDGKLPPAGTARQAPAWAETLSYLARSGLDDFYRGDVGREIAEDLRAYGSLVTRDDLRHGEARWRDPVSFRSSVGLVEVPPNRAGLRVLIDVGLFERLASTRPGSPAHHHGWIEALTRAEAMLAAADEDGQDPSALLEPPRLQFESDRIDMARATRQPVGTDGTQDGIGVGVIDREGLAVSLVQSIGTAFGSGCVLARTGLLMGNRGAGFELDDENGLVLRRGRRAPLDALPVVLADRQGGVTVVAVSSAWLTGAILAQRVSGAGFAEAVEARRVRPEGSRVRMETGGDPSDTIVLERLGHEVRDLDPREAGEASLLHRDSNGRVAAAVDPRRDGHVEGI